jgi:hypothetical protein
MISLALALVVGDDSAVLSSDDADFVGTMESSSVLVDADRPDAPCDLASILLLPFTPAADAGDKKLCPLGSTSSSRLTTLPARLGIRLPCGE